jgi:hypothetical protein
MANRDREPVQQSPRIARQPRTDVASVVHNGTRHVKTPAGGGREPVRQSAANKIGG